MVREESVETWKGEEFYEFLAKYKIDYLYKQLFGLNPKKGHQIKAVNWEEDGEIGGYYVFFDGKGNTKIV